MKIDDKDKTEVFKDYKNIEKTERENNDQEDAGTLKSKKTKIIDDTKYELVQYSSLHTFYCNRCNRTKKSKTIVYVSKDSEEQKICNACYGNLLGDIKKRKREYGIVSSDITPKDFYSRLPLLQQKLAEIKKCPICVNVLTNKKILVSLYDNNNTFVKKASVAALYCNKCNIGYADSHTAKYIRLHYKGLHADMFMLGKGKLGRETKSDLWSAINARCKLEVKEVNVKKLEKTTTHIGASQYVIKNTVPLGTTIYIGFDETHPCNGPMVGSLLPYTKMLMNVYGFSINSELKKCARCQKIFISESRYEKSKHVLANYEFVKKPIPVHKLTPRDFITRVNIFHCICKGHILKDVKCVVKVLDFEGKLHEVEVPAAYCSICKKYYILESEYQKIKEKGIIICKVVEKGFWSKEHYENRYNLNHESILHILGYNVNAQENISQSQRWRILEIAVDEKILTRTEICSHLDYLINRSKGRKNFEKACSKWLTDRNHIISYNINSVQRIEAQSIIVKKYK